MRRGSRGAFSSCGGGPLLQTMTISQPTIPTDGETKPTWTDLATGVPARRVFQTGNRSREVISGQRVVGLAGEEVTFRFRGDVTPQMRLRFPTTSGTDDVLEILSLGDPDGRRNWEVAECNRLEST